MKRYGLGEMLALGMVMTSGLVWAQAPAPPPPPPVPTTAFPQMAQPVPTRHLVGPPGVAATVNGQTISKTTISALAYQLAGADVLDRVINDTLVDQAAKRMHLTATPAEINTRFLQAKQQIGAQQKAQGLPVQSLDTLLAQSHQTVENFRDSLRLRILAEKLVGGQLTPIKLIHARHILVVTNANINPALKAHPDDDAKKIIAKAQDELAHGKTWDDVCKRYSEDPSNKDKGGDLGIIGTGMTQYDPTFLAAAVTLQAGQITPTPIKTIYGYHLIKADSTNAVPSNPQEKAAYAAAIATVRDAQYRQLIPPFLQKLRTQAKILNYLSP